MFKIQKMDFLVSLYIFCIVASEVMGAKTFSFPGIFGYTVNASVSIIIFPLIYTINDIVNEVYGPERTRSIVRSGLFVIILLLLFSLIATQLPPSQRFLPQESAYDAVFSLSIRFTFASLLAFIVSDFMDVYIFAKLRKAMGKKGLWIRNNVSNFISEFLDAFVFMVLAFWALDQSIISNLSFITSLAIPYIVIRWILSLLETPLVYAGVAWLKENKNTK
jgi:uncharacterized integral membrane protein (TIGR00697 family)